MRFGDLKGQEMGPALPIVPFEFYMSFPFTVIAAPLAVDM
jgi:hypothetical protein